IPSTKLKRHHFDFNFIPQKGQPSEKIISKQRMDKEVFLTIDFIQCLNFIHAFNINKGPGNSRPFNQLIINF
ncbi:TPA: hypothetical protein ACJHIK_002417, partial [Staphylococcus pseudintermedius]